MSKTADALCGECERVALVLQGGGSLGSYQAGVYQALNEAGYRPDWLAGISIGAINSAIIAGNEPDQRVERLRQFWTMVTRDHVWFAAVENDMMRSYLNHYSANETMMLGVDGFFTPRLPNPWIGMPNINPKTSYYDTEPLRESLETLIDFDLINDGPVRLSVGAVEVETGNFRYFDNKHQKIGPEHIMASGALPPGFPAVEIDGVAYWDGGLVSNTPLSIVLADRPRISTLVFQVDLFPADGKLPSKMGEVEARMKDIRYSSRTRLNTDVFRRLHQMRNKLHRLLDMMTDEQRADPFVQEIIAESTPTRMHIAHLIYHPDDADLSSKDYEFSRGTMERRWREGLGTTRHAIDSPEWRKRPSATDGVVVHDLTKIAGSPARTGAAQNRPS